MNLYKERNWTPMLLKEVSEPFNDKNYLYEIKFDGIRSIIFASPSEVVIYNRHCVDITKLYPELQDIKNLVNKKIVFDGEITLFDDGKPSFLMTCFIAIFINVLILIPKSFKILVACSLSLASTCTLIALVNVLIL